MLNAIITGATGGIGSAIARRLADGGYRVVLLGNKSADSLDKLQKRTCSPLALRGNLGNPSTVDNLIKQAMDLLGNVDLFVNCAGISHVGLITEESNGRDGQRFWMLIFHPLFTAAVPSFLI